MRSSGILPVSVNLVADHVCGAGVCERWAGWRGFHIGSYGSDGG